MAKPQTHPSDRVAALVASIRGVTVTRAPDVVISGVRVPQYDVACEDNTQALHVLNLLAGDDAEHGPKLRSYARRIAAWARADMSSPTWEETFARKAHAIARDLIVYLEDPSQVFRTSDVTLALGAGNCVNTARLIVALCRAVGIEARAVPVRPDGGEITHSAAQIRLPDGRWHWAEATIDARFDEEPLAAAKRLGVLRDDIAGDAKAPVRGVLAKLAGLFQS